MENGLSLGILIYSLCLILFSSTGSSCISIHKLQLKGWPIDRVRSVSYVLMNVAFHIFKDKL